jgi:hypothetical protein
MVVRTDMSDVASFSKEAVDMGVLNTWVASSTVSAADSLADIRSAQLCTRSRAGLSYARSLGSAQLWDFVAKGIQLLLNNTVLLLQLLSLCTHSLT